VHVHAKRGVAALVEEPRVQVGTVHSVKGASADTVVVFPDVTPAMYRAQATRDGMDAQTRTFYVAMTRAKRKLIMIGDSATLSNHAFFEDLLRYVESVNGYRSAWE
jgi:superfamily I DNA and/or RNA helicase